MPWKFFSFDGSDDEDTNEVKEPEDTGYRSDNPSQPETSRLWWQHPDEPEQTEQDRENEKN